jgi:GAF domain-containing protein
MTNDHSEHMFDRARTRKVTVMVREISSEATSVQLERIQDLERTLGSVREDSEIAHVLLGLSGLLGEVRSVEETLGLAVRTVREIFGADRCNATMWSRSTRRFKILAHDGYDEASLQALQEAIGQENGLPLLRSALSEGVPLFVPDTSNDPRIPADAMEARHLGAYIGLPLVRWGEEFGAVAVEFEKRHEFGSREIALGRGIARLLGVSLVNARRFNMLASLRAFGVSVARQLSLSSVIEDVAWGAVELLSGDSAKVYFLDSTHKSLVEAGAFEDDATIEAEQAVDQHLAAIDLTQSPWNELLRGTPVLVPDIGNEPEPLSVAAAPIPGEQSPILGAVLVFFRRKLASSPEELEALSVLAGQAGMAIENANRFERQRRVARSLQEGLLSTDLPAVASCTVAAVYEPASGDEDIGGDFYDMFELPDGRYGIAVGDVSGKGAEAAARTAMVKYMLRAFAMSNPSPASVMFNLNNALGRELDLERFATLVYGVLDGDNLELILARAGHPPPLVYRSSTKTVEALESIEGSILGAFEDQDYSESLFKLESGDVFLLYTDGLIEARGEAGFYGRKRIEEALQDDAQSLSPEELTRSIYSRVRDFGELGDDTVVFAIKCGNGS